MFAAVVVGARHTQSHSRWLETIQERLELGGAGCDDAHGLSHLGGNCDGPGIIGEIAPGGLLGVNKLENNRDNYAASAVFVSGLDSITRSGVWSWHIHDSDQEYTGQPSLSAEIGLDTDDNQQRLAYDSALWQDVCNAEPLPPRILVHGQRSTISVIKDGPATHSIETSPMYIIPDPWDITLKYRRENAGNSPQPNKYSQHEGEAAIQRCGS